MAEVPDAAANAARPAHQAPSSKERHVNKRFGLILALCAALVLLAAACGDDAETPAADDGTPAADDGTPADGEDLGLAQSGVLLVGSDLDFAPFEFVEGGEEKGFDIDLMNEIGSHLGVEVEYVNAAFDTIFTQLAGGEFDAVISAATITEERQQAVDFSDPYFEATQALVVATGSEIASVDDLADQDVGAQAGTTGLDYARETFTDSRIVEFPSYPAAFSQLEAGQIDAVLADLPAAVEAVEATGDAIEIVEEIDTDEQYGIAIQKGNDNLRNAVNDALADIVADGTYQRIFEEWFPGAELPERFRA
jgi:ABC-type amino acid transport substrate-binding protein